MVYTFSALNKAPCWRADDLTSYCPLTHSGNSRKVRRSTVCLCDALRFPQRSLRNVLPGSEERVVCDERCNADPPGSRVVCVGTRPTADRLLAASPSGLHAQLHWAALGRQRRFLGACRPKRTENSEPAASELSWASSIPGGEVAHWWRPTHPGRPQHQPPRAVRATADPDDLAEPDALAKGAALQLIERPSHRLDSAVGDDERRLDGGRSGLPAPPHRQQPARRATAGIAPGPSATAAADLVRLDADGCPRPEFAHGPLGVHPAPGQTLDGARRARECAGVAPA